jgi:hypothetical protein
MNDSLAPLYTLYTRGEREHTHKGQSIRFVNGVFAAYIFFLRSFVCLLSIAAGVG